MFNTLVSLARLNFVSITNSYLFALGLAPAPPPAMSEENG